MHSYLRHRRRTPPVWIFAAMTMVAAAAPAAHGGNGETSTATGDWFGVRETLARHGVELALTVQGDHSSTLAGGLQRGSVLRRPLGLALDIDTQSLIGWQGGHLHLGAQALDGRHGTDTLVGDAQGFDNIDAERYRQLSELWLEQRLWRDKLRVKAGKVDANSEFAHVERSSGFLNSSAGFSPTIQGFPTYPDPAASLNVLASVTPWLDLGAGLYDGATHEGCHGRTGNRGIATLWGAPSALFLVGEAGLRFNVSGRPGRLGVGSWKHTGAFEGLDGATTRDARGWYAVFDQSILSEKHGDPRGLGVFAQLGVANARLSEIDRHVSFGVAASGLVPRRDADTLGLMVSTIRFSRYCHGGAGNRRETAIEAFYGGQLKPWLSVKPDLQIIITPGGGATPNAVVGTLRLVLSL